ncbi:electron transport complex subunit RsxC [Psychromonas ossibalaenae]|uniref:electron transport complex subunit RsxC n=1 Tax=Psychromonas ossibalaenae TaxID=444922 RepID=UPI000377C6EA|nr:electron transport complex subunit RsxC [Psychromonas ossibalaenae]
MTTQSINLLSEEQLAHISSGKQWNFHGGVHPQENKIQSSGSAICDAGIPEFLVIGIEHKGHSPELLVKVGDPVLKGQALTKVYGAMVVQHASSSGIVYAVEKRTDLHPSGLAVLSIVIKTDGLDRSIAYNKPDNFRNTPSAALIETIQHAGIVGLGGAGFPSHLKLSHTDGIKLLIINAAECEPYITADDRLMQEHAQEVFQGIEVLEHILQPKLIVIAVEDNKPEAVEALHLALQKIQLTLKAELIIRTIPTLYPSGSEKQLIEIITGRQTPLGKHPTELGIVMQNVGTVFAIKEAVINGKPLTSRIVTLTGDALRKKGNASVRIGTPIQYLLDKYQFNSDAAQKLIIGGPMMGFSISHGDIPVTKTCNCILAPTAQEMPVPPAEMPCIRCGECAHACPALLLPQQLLWYSQSKDHDKLNDYNLSACIECGACAFVCPSNIPLVEYYRIAKAEINTAVQEAKKAETARIRHENREARLEQAKIDRQAKHKQAAEKRKQQLKKKNGGEDLIAAALARAKAKKSDSTENENNEQTNTPKSAAAAAVARAKAKKAALAEAASESTAADTTDKPKNDAVAAAIARTKAKKAAAQQNSQSDTGEETQVEPKKAAVAAAIARAKAKKAAAQEKSETAAEETQVDPKKAAVAAAIARAKAKKAAAQEKSETAAEETQVDPKKAAVAAAIARAKAKKAAAQQNSETAIGEEAQVDPKKTAVAAAIARAKAKKAAAQQKSETASAEETPAAPKKAAVAAAIAKAKAKKAASQNEPDNSTVIAAREKRKEQARLHKQEKQEQKDERQTKETVENNLDTAVEKNSTAAEDKKAKIAAAVAKAKAKQTAQKDQ